MPAKRIWNFIKAYWPSLVVGAGILYLSIIRAPHIRMDHIANEDKMSHMFAYFVFALCISYTHWRTGVSYAKRILWGMVIPILYGGLIEVLQENFFKPRSGEWLDWYADATGVVLGFLLADRIYHYLISKRDAK